jgi:hypothetical protein
MIAVMESTSVVIAEGGKLCIALVLLVCVFILAMMGRAEVKCLLQYSGTAS